MTNAIETAALITVDPCALAKADWLLRRDTLADMCATITAIDDDRTSAAVRDLQRDCTALAKELDKHRKEITAPVNAAIKYINAQAREMTGVLEHEKARLKSLNGAYAERQAAAAAEAEARRRDALSEAVASGADTSDIPPTAPVSKPKGAVERWEFEVYDIAAVPREYLQVNEAAVRAYVQFAKSQNMRPAIEGLAFTKKLDVR